MADADLFIVGSGATAFAAAIRAGDLGAKVAIAERRTIGGTCVNRGCLPSKNLLEAARAVWEARHPRFPGIAAADVEVDLPALLAQKDEVVRSYRHRKYEKVAEEIVNLDLIDGDVTIAGPHELLAEGRRYPARYLLIATGSRPDVPPIPGLDAVPYLTSDLLDADEPGRLTRLPSSLLILGGGYVAVELAQLFSRLGSRVTVLQRSRRLLSDHEPEVGLILRQVFENEGIELVTGAQVRSVDGDGDVVRVAAEVRDETRTVEAQRLLVATGRRPNSDGLGLEAIGVELDDGGAVVVDPELRTSQPWVWAAGDVIGSQAGSQMATPGRGAAGHDRRRERPPGGGSHVRRARPPPGRLHRSPRRQRGAHRRGRQRGRPPLYLRRHPARVRAARGRHASDGRSGQVRGRRRQRSRPRRDDGRRRRSRGDPRGGDGAALRCATAGLRRPRPCLPHDERGAQDRSARLHPRRLPALLLRRVAGERR